MTYTVTNHLFLAPKYLVTTNTAVQSTSNTAGVRTVLNGSSIEYTPDSDASYVIYEFSVSSECIQDTTFHSFELKYSTDNGSSYQVVNNRAIIGHGNDGSTQSQRWFHHFRYVIPAYTGSRLWRLETGSFISNERCDYHALSEWDGAASTTKFTNSTLIMYSLA